MTKALKIVPTLDINNFQKHMNQTDQLIYKTINKSAEIGSRDCFDRIFANNTKDLAELQEMQSIVAKKQSQAITGCLMVSLKNTKATQEVVQSMSEMEEHLYADLDRLNIIAKETSENLHSDFNKQQEHIEKLKVSIDAQVLEQEKFKNLINLSLVSEIDNIKDYSERSTKDFQIQIEKITNEMNIIMGKNKKLTKLVVVFLVLFSCLAMAVTWSKF